MKKKFENAFKALIKDYGLSDKAVAELVEQGQVGIDDNATEEMVESQANLFANIAKAMQGEVTRKVQAVKQTQKSPEEKLSVNTPQANPEDNGGGDQHKPNEQENAVLKQLQEMQKQLTALQVASEQSAKEKAETARQSIVQEAAKKVGVDEGMLRFYNTANLKTAEEAEKFFSEIKQTQVNNTLPQKGLSVPQGTSTKSDEEAAEAWAKNLSDKK